MRRLALAVALLGIGSSPALAQQGALVCLGTEPFWNVTHTGQAMFYSSPDVQRLELVPVRAANAVGTQPDVIRVYQTRRVDGRGRGPVTLVVTRTKTACSDDMSDRDYPYHAVYINEDGAVFAGCCRWGK